MINATGPELVLPLLYDQAEEEAEDAPAPLLHFVGPQNGLAALFATSNKSPTKPSHHIRIHLTGQHSPSPLGNQVLLCIQDLQTGQPKLTLTLLPTGG
jgi:hypothetical protein